MTQERFHELIHIVLDSLGSAAPPHDLFAGGVDDWHARARLAHFLAQTEEYHAEALDLFLSIVDTEPNEELAQDVEEKVYAMQGLSALEAADKATQEAALEHINLAIECAESTDFLYKYILRGELWADRWNLMHKLRMTEEAEAEADERIAAFDGLAEAVPHNSYLYYGYRFKAHLAAEADLLLLDEPTAGLDATRGERLIAAVLETLDARGGTLIVITHDLPLLDRMKQVIEL